MDVKLDWLIVTSRTAEGIEQQQVIRRGQDQGLFAKGKFVLDLAALEASTSAGEPLSHLVHCPHNT